MNKHQQLMPFDKFTPFNIFAQEPIQTLSPLITGFVIVDWYYLLNRT